MLQTPPCTNEQRDDCTRVSCGKYVSGELKMVALITIGTGACMAWDTGARLGRVHTMIHHHDGPLNSGTLHLYLSRLYDHDDRLCRSTFRTKFAFDVFSLVVRSTRLHPLWLWGYRHTPRLLHSQVMYVLV